VVISQFLREEQSEGQMNKQNNSKNERDHGKQIHALPQLVACLDVEKRQAKENRREQQHRCILHRRSLISGV